jgi:hypothetical protein
MHPVCYWAGGVDFYPDSSGNEEKSALFVYFHIRMACFQANLFT